jgi:hypothetical protein
MTGTRTPILPEGASFGLNENWLPCSLSLGVALLAIVLLETEGWWWVSFAIFILVDLYILLVLVEMALRSKRDKWRIFELPHRLWSIPLLFCLLVAVVCSFGNLYVQSGSVKNNGSVLTDRGDAVYFSVVTITTLGYGDFVPTEPRSRRLVIYELGTGFLLLLFIFPVLASRIAAMATTPPESGNGEPLAR